MKLSELRFFEMVTVPLGRKLGEETFADACEATFSAADGWELVEISTGRLSLRAPHMGQPFMVVASDYGYFEAPPEPTPVVAVVDTPKGKRR